MNAVEKAKAVLIGKVVGEVGETVCEVMGEDPSEVWKMAFARQIGKVIEVERKEEEYLRVLVKIQDEVCQTNLTPEAIVEHIGTLVGSVLQGEEEG